MRYKNIRRPGELCECYPKDVELVCTVGKDRYVDILYPHDIAAKNFLKEMNR